MDLYKLNKILFFIFLGILFLHFPLNAQTVVEKENRLNDLNSFLQSKMNSKEAMQSELNTLLKDIEIEKSAENPNDGFISNLLADALDISSKIDNIKEEIKSINDEISVLRKTLYKNYSSICDSLKKSKTSNEPATVAKIKLYNTKKISVSPMLRALSFDPLLIQKISFKNNQPDEEKSIYLNYLNNAYKEVDSIIVLLEQKSEDVHEMIRLEEMAEDFTDDLDNIAIGGVLLSSGGNQIQNQGNKGIGLQSETISMSNINHSLQPFVYSNLEMNKTDGIEFIYLEDYLNLIIETEKTLRLYNKIIYELINNHVN